MTGRAAPRAMVLYRDSALRRRALAAAAAAPERYTLFGLDELVAAGLDVEHNLDHPPSRPTRWIARVGNRALTRAGGYGGDFATVLANRRRIAQADVVLATVDTVGLPLVLSRRALRLRAPVVYVSVGLPERLERLRGERLRTHYRRAFEGVAAIVAYSDAELAALRAWLDPGGVAAERFHFVPFGVDTDAFAPGAGDPAAELDVVSVGADPHRDFSQLLAVARANPGLRVRVVTTREHLRALGPLPSNVLAEVDVPLESVRRLLLAAKVVALPVDHNTYSSATTVLLQAMACGRAVVLSRTPAAAAGYHLDDGSNCVLVEPGDAEGLGQAVLGLLDDERRAAAIGAAARATAVEHLGWDRYTARLREIVVAAAATRPGLGRKAG